MKRDIDLVRNILVALEDYESPSGLVELEIAGHGQPEINYHLTIMVEAGLLYGQEYSHDSVSDTLWMYVRLTWQGHEFLDAARDDSRWAEVSAAAKDADGWTLDTVMELLTASLRPKLGLGDA